MAQKKSSLIYLPVLIAFCSLLGGIYGPRVEVAAAATEDDIRTSLKVFTKVYNAVEDNFADAVNPDKGIYKGAIPGMLRAFIANLVRIHCVGSVLLEDRLDPTYYLKT